MKAKKLIKLLEDLVEEYGDCDIIVYDNYHSSTRFILDAVIDENEDIAIHIDSEG